jgi:Flp pilus assembly protein TadD
MRIARAALALAAAVVCAWFAVGIRQARDMSRASAVINSSASITPAARAHTSSLLRAAGWLNPDRQVDILRGQLAGFTGDVPGAVTILRRVTRSEPMNIQAWAALATATLNQSGYRTVFVGAIRAIGRLDPRVK